MIGRRSISVRLTVWFSAVFFAGLTLFGAFMWLCLDHTLTAGRSHTLERRAVRLAQLLEETRHDLPAERIRRFDAFADATGGGMVEIFRPDGTRALPSPTEASRAFPWPGISTLDRDRFVETVFQAQTYRVLLRPLTSVSPPLILCVAAPLEGNRLVMNAFSAGLAWTIPALLALSALGGYLLSRRALRPVDQITAAARSISVSNLSGRLPVPETHDELQRLSETCNQMLARLEAAVNEIKRFTGDASHELRNPVSFVRTTAELALRNRRIDDASRRAFEEIVEECGKANGLLKDMLTLARADAGNSPLAFEAVDLVEVVRALSPKARLLAEECGHTFAISIDGTACATVCGDYPSLHRLLWILLDNAAKYTPAPGWIRIAVSAAGDRAIVTVEDNGIGISEADLPHIFERFYRADPSRGRVEGSGLGLAIALWIANVHQASLSVSSKQGAGSVFRVVFPLLSAGAKRPKASAAPHLLTTAG